MGKSKVSVVTILYWDDATKEEEQTLFWIHVYNSPLS